jgi:hypothetical protein
MTEIFQEFRNLPVKLIASAFLDKAGEPAWCKKDALQVIECLTRRNLAIVGGEVWLATRKGPVIPSPGIYTWTCPEVDYKETWSGFLDRANEFARNYVLNHKWDQEEELRYKGFPPYFNFSVIEEGEDVL